MKEQIEKYKQLFSLMLQDLKTQGKRHKQIPNILTLSRLTAPLIIIPLFITGNFMTAFYSIAAFSLTDALDGFIARTFHLTSDLGRDLDAVADKLFAATLLISLSTVNPIYLISLLMEIVIGSICANKKMNKIDIRTCKVGKLKTILLDVSIVLGMGSILLESSPILLNILCGITTLLQMKTATEYIKVNDVNLSQQEDTPNENVQSENLEETEYHKTIKYPYKYTENKNKAKTLVKTREKK